MQSVPRFSDMPYERPTPEDINNKAQKLISAWDGAVTVAEQTAIIQQWDDNTAEYETNHMLAQVHFQQRTTDPDAKEEQVFFDNLNPVVLENNLSFLKRVTTTPNRKALEEQLGSQAFALWDCFLGTFAPEISELSRQESKLRTEYSELLAGLEIPFQGETYNLSSMRGFYGNKDRSVRLGAQQAKAHAMESIAPELDRIYDDLVKVRHEMATTLGYDTFTPLGYRRMDRTDYDDSNVEQFRKQVREVVVPLAQRIYARRAESLGIPDFKFHDESVRDHSGVPCPDGDHDWMLERATEMFDTLGDDFGSFFRMMADTELLDLKSRPGKSGGGFCADIPRYGVPFIFANFNGTQDDVNVFTHECGHAFQNWSSRDQPLLAYHWPTTEAAEIHSMSLEFLTYPHMEQFFGDDAERFRTGHLEAAILFLPYGCAVDEFQHRVYENPSMTPDERAAVWSELESVYLPQRQYVDMPVYDSGRLWQAQRHIYGMPFYYIDYCLAQTCALQMWHAASIDRESAMTRYRALCKLGGSMPFTQLLSAVGLANPFDDGCLETVCDAARETLGL